MGYIKKKYAEMLHEIDSRWNDLPSKWDKFIDETKMHHNLIIKRAKNSAICTNCKHEFITKKNIGEYEKCPNCKNTYKIKSSRLKKFWFCDTLILLDKVDDKLVFRYFELWSKYNNREKYYGFENSVVEFGRSFFDERFEVVNERMSGCQCYIHINHLRDSGKWREYSRSYDFGKYGYVYSYNLKEILKDTEYKYIDFSDFIKKVERVEFEYLLKNAAIYPSFEMLTKMKLYNLALQARAFRNGKTFEERFGVSKDYYKFMKRNNITLNELKILQLLKEKNIEKIRYLSKYDIDTLDRISKYISINKLIKYLKMHRKKVDIHSYKDYLKFASGLGFDMKNKKYIYPNDLKTKHDELAKQYKVKSKEILDNAIRKRYEDLKKYIYQNEDYVIIPAKSAESLEQESKQQSNCVRTYSEDYANGNCDIYFMRLVKEKNKSLVTVEVKNKKIVQSRIKYNNMPEEIQKMFLKMWEQKVLQGV